MILIFGANGMLGHYMCSILSSIDTIYPCTRKDFNIDMEDWSMLMELLHRYQPNIIVNCAGLIPQKGSHSIASYFRVNTMFPHKLQKYCNQSPCKLIHITTDCVYSGNKGFYCETECSDVTNIYGHSKYLGEPLNACVLRTSIIGEELSHKTSLLEWVRQQKEINGYVNHHWNGVTCLTLSEIVKLIIQENYFWKGVRHIHSPNSVSKYELCKMIAHVYELNISVIPYQDKKAINRTLNSLYPIFYIKPIEDQLKKQKEFQLCNPNISY